MKIVYALLLSSLGVSTLANAREFCHAHCLVVQSGYVTTFSLEMLYGLSGPPGDSVLRHDLGQVQGSTIEDLRKSCETLVDRVAVIYLASETATVHLAQDYRLDTSRGEKVVTGLTEKSSCP